MDEQFKQRIQQIFVSLDDYSYYDLLNLKPGATPDDIRARFHRVAALLHPDKFAQNPDATLRKMVYAIYKRTTEGYRVLMDTGDRREYDQGLQQGRLRLVRTERKIAGPRRTEAAIEQPQARKFFNLAQDAERRGDLKNARINYKFALDMAPEHPTIMAAMDAVDAKLAES